MPFDGSGNFNLTDGSFTGRNIFTSEKAAAQLVTAAHFDAFANDIAAGLANSVTRDGQVSGITNLQLSATVSVATGVITIGGVVFANMFGTGNVFVGNSGNFSLSGSQNSALGSSALAQVTSGSSNTAFGQQALTLQQTGSFNVALGNFSLATCVSSNNTGVGFQSLLRATGSGAANNVGIGYTAAQNVSTGIQNTVVGAQGGATIATGSQNIVIGYLCDVPSATNSGQMSLGNIIYGFGNTGTGSTPSTGRIAIGTSFDDGLSSLNVAGPQKASLYGCSVVSHGVVGGSDTITWQAQQYTLTLTNATACTLTFNAPTYSGLLVLRITAPSSGTAPSVTFPANVFGTPAVPTVLSKRGLTTFWFDGTNFIVVGSQNNY